MKWVTASGLDIISLHARRFERSSNMPNYRAYIIGSDGEFHNVVSIECADDEVAVKKAEQLVGGHHVELWQFTRKIATFDRKSQRVFQR